MKIMLTRFVLEAITLNLSFTLGSYDKAHAGSRSPRFQCYLQRVNFKVISTCEKVNMQRLQGHKQRVQMACNGVQGQK